jgi:hypothetical protein
MWNLVQATIPSRLALASVLALAVMAAVLCASSASATVLCKTASSPCSGGTYGKGTTFEASLKAGTKWALSADKTRSCEEATIKGEVTNAGGTPGVPVTGTVTSMNLGKCSGVIEVTKLGTFSITSSAASPLLTLEGFEINAGGGVCLYGGPATTNLTPGSMASIGVNTTLPKVGGTGICPTSASWTAEFTVTSPEPLYIPTEPPATVLCKVAKNPCPAESAYGKGQNLALELMEGTLFTFRTGEANYLACTKVLIEGKIATDVGSGIDVGGTVSEFSFGGCSNEVTVLNKGKFSINYTSGNNGTLSLEGFEVKEKALGCTYTGPASLGLTGGAMAGAGINSGVAGKCLFPLAWNAEFTVTEPEPLYVSEL